MKVALLCSGLAALALAALLFHGGPGGEASRARSPAKAPAAPPKKAPAAPPGWELEGSHLESYEVGLEPGAGRSGGPALRLAAAAPPPPDAVVDVARRADVAPYRGHSLALTASVRTEGVGGWAGLWLCVDTARRVCWALDNMSERPIRGTRAWQSYRLVLEVPDGAVGVQYGALLTGRGTAWFDGFELAQARPGEPSTEPELSRLRRRGLDFEPLPSH